MRIAVLSSHTPSLFWFRMEMMQRFIEKGHSVYALGNERESEWQKKFAEKGIIYHQINIQRNGTNPVKDVKCLISIKKQLKNIKPDKVFTYQAKTVIYGTIAANILGIAEVYPLIAGLGSLFLNDDVKTKVIKKILVSEYRYALRKCPAVFFQNTDDVHAFKGEKIIKDQQVVLLHGSGVNLEVFQEAPLPETFAFLCISRLIRDKGVFEYIKASEIIKKEYPDVRCMLVGPFDSNPSSIRPEQLQPYIDSGIIEYFGEQADVTPYLEQCSVFVLPSYREGTPKTVLEAMASGRAVVTTDAPGCREAVLNKQNGLLVPIKDIEALVEAMRYMIQSPQEMVCMAKEGRKRAENLFDVKKVNEKICQTMKL